MHSNSETYFSEELVEKIPTDLIDGVRFICKEFFNNLRNFEKGSNLQIELFAAFAVLNNYLKNHNIDAGKDIEFTMDLNKLKNYVVNYFRSFSTSYNQKFAEREARQKFDELNAKISSKFGNYIIYELNDNQLNEIQNLTNRLRDKILNCNEIDEIHRQRVLRKLEKLQAEIHIKMTNFDKVFGFVVETKLLYEQYRETKPVFELAIKIANIALDSMALSNGLPAPSLFKLT